MKPAPFDYVAPKSIEHALSVIADLEQEVKVLAGGQSLIPVMNMRMGHPEILVDICRLAELRHYDIDENGALHIRSGVRQATILADETIINRWPMLCQAIAHIGHPQIRSRGTVCGSVTHADPAAELPAVAIALNATMVARSRRGERTIAASEFFVAPFTTALGDDEILTEIIFPRAERTSGWAFDEFATRRGDFATVGSAASITRDENTSTVCRLVLFGVGGTPVRITTAEEAFTAANTTDAAIEAAGKAVETEVEPSADVHASAQFRKELAVQLATRTLEKAWEASIE